MAAPKTWPWSRAQHLRLFVSYQRYTFLLLAGAIGGSALGVLAAENWLGGLAWVAAIASVLLLASLPLRFAIFVASRWPRKLRATALAYRRIEQGRFSHQTLESYCGDPCYRVVAHEILRKAGLPAETRKGIVKDYQAKAREPAFLVVVNPHAPAPVRVEGALFEAEQR